MLDLLCLDLQGRAEGLRFDWENLDSDSWPDDIPEDMEFRVLPVQYGISACAPKLLWPGRPLAWELQQLEAFLIRPINVRRGTTPLAQTTVDTDMKGKLHMYMGFLLLNEGIKVCAHKVVASFVAHVRADIK